MIFNYFALVFSSLLLVACGVVGGGSSGKSQNNASSTLGGEGPDSYVLESPVNGFYYINNTKVPGPRPEVGGKTSWDFSPSGFSLNIFTLHKGQAITV